MRNMMESGEMRFGQDAPKVATYEASSSIPQLGMQTSLPIPDKHFSQFLFDEYFQNIGAKGEKARSLKTREFQKAAPWYRDKVAKPLGIEGRSAQGLQWGFASPVTGVRSPVGAPKLEILSDYVAMRAKQAGVPEEDMLRQILLGEMFANPASAAPFSAVPAGGLAAERN